MELDVAEFEEACTRQARPRVDHLGLEGGQGRYHLVGRARRIDAGDRLVVEGPLGIIEQVAPFGLRDAAREGRGIEAGCRDHGDHVAGDDVEHDDGAALVLLHLLHGEALDVEVDGQQRVGAGLALRPVEFANDATDGVDLDLNGAGTTPQIVLERALDALLAEPHGRELQHRIVAAGEILVGDAAGVAHDVAHQLAFGIVARLAEIDEHAGQVGGVELEPRHLFPAEILAHHDGLGAAAAAQLAQQADLLRLAQAEDLVEALDQQVGAAATVRRCHGAEIVAVDGERHAAAVEDLAARRRQQPHVDAVLLGHRGEPVGLDDLQLVQAAGQRRQQHRLCAAQHQRAAREQAAALAVALAEILHSAVSPVRAPPRDSSGMFSGSRARTRASSGASRG